MVGQKKKGFFKLENTWRTKGQLGLQRVSVGKVICRRAFSRVVEKERNHASALGRGKVAWKF